VSRAFWGFAEHFPAQAESLLMSVDATKQKQLMGDQPSNMSLRSSANSRGGRGGKPSRQTSANARGSTFHGRESSGIISIIIIIIMICFLCVFSIIVTVINIVLVFSVT